MKTSAAFYGRLKRFWDFLVVLSGFIFLLLPHFGECCWGKEAPKHGDMTRDYDLLAGNELVLNCTLNSNQVRINDLTYTVNSSNLLFKKGSNINSSYIKYIDDLTAQLRLPNAKSTDSGMYYCQLSVPQLSAEHLVCSSQVNVGYPPKPAKNFTCISRHYKNLTCTWDIEDSGVQTKYTLFKSSYFFSNFFKNAALQKCPMETLNNTFCQWRDDTDPPFERKEKVFTFMLQGNNTLGSNNETFILNHFEIFVPSRPESLIVGAINKQNISLHWSPPAEIHAAGQPPLMYQMWIEEMIGERERKVFDIGLDVTSYTVFGLVPFMMYNISLRCRSKFTNSTEMWSPFLSIQNQTLPDVPYNVPEIVPEAFELHHYDGYRTVTIYWKPVSSKYFNGDDFKYHIVYSQNNSPGNNIISTARSINTTALTVTFNKLQTNISYSFRLFTMNKEGLSNNYKAIFVDSREKLPGPPEDIRAISHDWGHYQMSWKPPSKNASSVVDYVVFWCTSLRPWLSRCDSPIQWLSTPIKGNNITLNLPDTSVNFQFAIVARTLTASSGMQWATCIVPFKSALGKITNVNVEPKSSTSLKMMWGLDCSAQKAVVQKFEIDYCKIDEKKKCTDKKESVTDVDPSAETFLLQNLQPFSNYSVIIRAYNLAGVASEDSDPKVQQTLQGAPFDPPQNVKAVALPNAALEITWKSPLQPNGIITHYTLLYNTIPKKILVNKGENSFKTVIDGLMYYMQYNISLEACVSHYCSPMSEVVAVQTGIGVPGVMDPPRVETVNSSFVKVYWNQPLMPNGPIYGYEIWWGETVTWNASRQDNSQFKRVEEGLSSFIEMKCSNMEDGGIKYNFAIRAVNFIDFNKVLYGPLSDSSQVRACLIPQGVAMIIGVAVGGTFALALVMLMTYKLIKWMSDKILQVKNTTVRLPKGLEAQETNPLNNYENFKKGLIPQTLNNNNIGRLSYIVDDYDKNRHGSGSSQYSFCSTEELLYKNGKCTKFVRKPSGESSGCSSMSSNITKLHSSDSSTESDFMTPPSPDITFYDHHWQNGLKVNLPIVVEAQDSLNSNSIMFNEDHPEYDEKCEEKNNGISDGVVLKIEPPYSRIGVSKNTRPIPMWWMNPLTVYSSSLSSSEPSVTEVKEPVAVFVPYSKIGLAKSSGDILGLTQAQFDLGYSKLGVIAASKVDTPHFEFGKRLLPNHLAENECCVNDFFSKYQYLNHAKEKESMFDNGDFFRIAPFVGDINTPLVKRMGEINGDDGYIKFRRSNPNTVSMKSGYVPYNEVSNMSAVVPVSGSSAAANELQRISIDRTKTPSTDIEELTDRFASKDSVFTITSPELIKPPTDVKLNGEQKKTKVYDLPKKILKSCVYPANDFLDNNKDAHISKEMIPSHTSMQFAPHSQTETHSNESYSSKRNQVIGDARTNYLGQKGYVPLATLTNLNSDISTPRLNPSGTVKNHSIVEEDCGSQYPDKIHPNTFTPDAFEPSLDCTKLNDSKANHSEVPPMTNNIPRCKCDHIESPKIAVKTCSDFSQQYLAKFGPKIESEICEV